jgi:hypothetical protein
MLGGKWPWREAPRAAPAPLRCASTGPGTYPGIRGILFEKNFCLRRVFVELFSLIVFAETG